MNAKYSIKALGRVALTLLFVAAAIVAGAQLWRHYEVEPWTRDGRVRTNIIQVAPDVGGQVVRVYVHDNQPVRAGQILFEIDPARYRLALRQAEASERAQRTALAQAQKEARRNAELGKLVSQEAREQGQAHVQQIRAALEQASVGRDTARLNLERTRVLSPVDGYVTNLDLQAGGYASAGHAVMALVDSHGFYVEGYFEETKLAQIRVGDPVQVHLMGQAEALSGHVVSFAEVIADRDRATGSYLLPNVNPTFNWVRLAQRIPVRVALDRVPPDVRLIAGRTATVEVLAPRADRAVHVGPEQTS